VRASGKSRSSTAARYCPWKTAPCPILKGGQREGHEPIYWEHQGHRAVRCGDWKLVASHREPWEIYTLAEDRTETENLAARYPDQGREQMARYQGPIASHPLQRNRLDRVGVRDWRSCAVNESNGPRRLALPFGNEARPATRHSPPDEADGAKRA